MKQLYVQTNRIESFKKHKRLQTTRQHNVRLSRDLGVPRKFVEPQKHRNDMERPICRQGTHKGGKNLGGGSKGGTLVGG